MGIFQQARHEQPTEVGQGFRIYDVVLRNGNETNLMIFNHRELVNQIHFARNFALHNGGNLPNTEFWNKTVEVFDENRSLFSLTHQCDRLLALLRRNDAYDRTHPIIPIEPITPICPIIPIDCNPIVCTPSVPEPSSLLLMALGFAAIALVFQRKRKWKKPTYLPV